MTHSAPQTPRSQWLVVLYSFLALTLSGAAKAVLGLSTFALMAEHGWSLPAVTLGGAAAAAVGLLMMAALAPVAGRLVDRRGPRVALLYGVDLVAGGCILIAAATPDLIFLIGGVGLALLLAGDAMLAFHVLATAITQGGRSRTGLKIGLALSGFIIAQAVVAPLMLALFGLEDWSLALLTIGLASLALVPCLHLSLRPGPDGPAEAAAPAPRLGSGLLFILKRPAFYLLFAGASLSGFTAAGLIEEQILNLIIVSELEPHMLQRMLAFMALAAAPGVILAGYLADRMNRPLLLGAICLTKALGIVLLLNLPAPPIDPASALVILTCALCGATAVAGAPVVAMIVARHFGLRVMGLATGVIAAGYAIGQLAGRGTRLGTMTATGFNDRALEIAVWLLVLAAALAFLLPAFRRKQARPAGT